MIIKNPNRTRKWGWGYSTTPSGVDAYSIVPPTRPDYVGTLKQVREAIRNDRAYNSLGGAFHCDRWFYDGKPLSAYIVDDITIDRIVTYLFAEVQVSALFDLYGAPQALGEAMLKLNYKAVNSRYGSRAKPAFPYVYKETPAPKIQAIKSLSCFLYQCDEVANTKLYKALKEMLYEMMNDYISDLPEYQEAIWG
jgi:hypothetical protein